MQGGPPRTVSKRTVRTATQVRSLAGHGGYRRLKAVSRACGRAIGICARVVELAAPNSDRAHDAASPPCLSRPSAATALAAAGTFGLLTPLQNDFSSGTRRRSAQKGGQVRRRRRRKWQAARRCTHHFRRARPSRSGSYACQSCRLRRLARSSGRPSRMSARRVCADHPDAAGTHCKKSHLEARGVGPGKPQSAHYDATVPDRESLLARRGTTNAFSQRGHFLHTW